MRDVERVLMCLFKEVTYGEVICDELEWNCKKGGAEVLVTLVWSTHK